MDNISEIIQEIMNKLQGWWESAVLMLPNFVMAALVVLAFILLGKLLKKGTQKVLRKFSDNKAINNLLGTITYIVIISIGLFFALGLLDLDKTVTSLLAGVGVIGLALGFAFQNTAANLISGIFMATEFPLNVGDLVESNGYFGKIEKIGLRYTTMRSFQGQIIVIPNKDILENSLVNYSVTNERRVDITCGVGYGDDLEKAEQVAVRAVENINTSDQPVEVRYDEFGDSSINFTLRFWLKDIEHKDYVLSRSEAVKAIKKAFEEENINIPFPIRTLEFNPEQFKKVLNTTILTEKNGVGSNQLTNG